MQQSAMPADQAANEEMNRREISQSKFSRLSRTEKIEKLLDGDELLIVGLLSELCTDRLIDDCARFNYMFVNGDYQGLAQMIIRHIDERLDYEIQNQ